MEFDIFLNITGVIIVITPWCLAYTSRLLQTSQQVRWQVRT